MTVLVTGATGFVGGHVARLLCESGERVRLLLRPGSDRRLLAGLSYEGVQGDLTDITSLRRALTGCRRLFHVAAHYSLWAADPAILYRSNVEGTRNILEVARQVGVERIVYTSTVGALGNPGDGRPGTEETAVSLSEMVGHYKRSKYLAEQAVLAAAREGLPVVIVNPSTPVGPADVKPTPTGQMIVGFLNGRMPAYIETGLNLIAVEDVARGHLLAMEKGRGGEKYILGNRNLSLKEILEMLGQITGLTPPRIRLPRWSVLPLAYVGEKVSRLTGRPPRIPLEGVRMAKKKMFFDPTKAVRELGLPQSSVEEALARAVEWFRSHGYVRP